MRNCFAFVKVCSFLFSFSYQKRVYKSISRVISARILPKRGMLCTLFSAVLVFSVFPPSVSQDEIIYIHRHWVPDSERKIYPQNLHLQFHGREMHSLCFISENSRFGKQSLFPNSCWIATGCEDGTVRMTRYDI